MEVRDFSQQLRQQGKIMDVESKAKKWGKKLVGFVIEVRDLEAIVP